ncbi:MAG TPA: hypothetical protein VF794_33615 [Archangium sp.]|uniref:hypothetical protein n=1 Tax=Archangium sp. TaxID=1872627 RepID=UPI002ED875B2
MDDAQSGQEEREHPLGVEVFREKAGEEFMDLLLVDCWSTHFFSNVHDPTAPTKQPANPFLACFSI